MLCFALSKPARNRFFIKEDADDVGAPLDLAIEALDQII